MNRCTDCGREIANDEEIVLLSRYPYCTDCRVDEYKDERFLHAVRALIIDFNMFKPEDYNGKGFDDMDVAGIVKRSQDKNGRI